LCAGAKSARYAVSAKIQKKTATTTSDQVTPSTAGGLPASLMLLQSRLKIPASAAFVGDPYFGPR
jgi:hypothetical protein